MKFSDRDREAMRRALDLAANGRGLVEPNPMVGAVLLGGGEVVGEGWHRAFGGAHAEVEAIRSAAGKAADTLIVNLEPCHHDGKTPPCTKAIAEAGISRVVVGMRDPNPDVAGGGAQALRGLGVRVEEGCLEEECRRLNAPFEKWATRRIPYVTAKWAMSLDGRMAARTGDSRWISSEASREVVHDLRGVVDAILVGIGTVLEDDPLLTCRTGPRRIARRVIADSRARTPPDCRMLSEGGEAEVIIAVGQEAPKDRISALEAAGGRIWVLPAEGGKVDLRGLLGRLGEEGATHLLAEGGPTILGGLFREGQVDRVLCFVSPGILGGEAHPVAGWGVERASGRIRLDDVRLRRLDGDFLIEGTVMREVD